MTAELRDQLLAELEQLPDEEVEAVLKLVRLLPHDASERRRRLPFGPISDEDAAEMLRIIEEDCERIDPEGW